jgi:hypothetical protein
MPNVEPSTKAEQDTDYQQFHEAVADKDKQEKVFKAMDAAFAPL